MMALGLIGTALAGAAVGAGEAGKQFGQYLERSTLQDEAAKIQAIRDQTLAEQQRVRDERLHGQAVELQTKVIQPFQRGERLDTQDWQRTMEESIRQPFQIQLQDAGFKQAEKLQSAQQVFQGEQNKLQRDLTREQIASQEKISAANNATAIRVASIGGTIQQDKDGNMLFFDKAGKGTQIMDPNNPDKPLKGFKDLSPAAKVYVDTIKSELVDLDRQEVAAMGDQTQLASIAKRRAILNAQQLNVLTGGISAAADVKPPAPTPADIARAKQLSRDPNAKAVFVREFGQAAWDSAVAPAPAAPNPPAAAPGKIDKALPPAPIPAGVHGADARAAQLEAERKRMIDEVSAKFPARQAQTAPASGGRPAKPRAITVDDPVVEALKNAGTLEELNRVYNSIVNK